MTVDVKFGTVIDAIAGLSISGVTIRDTDQIPENPEAVLPVLFPDPDDMINDISPEFMSYGSGGVAAMNMTYTLNYIYLHAKIGAGAGLVAVMPGLITKLSLILETFWTNDVVSGAVDLRNNGIRIGVITGPNGMQFHGATISLRVLEHVQ